MAALKAAREERATYGRLRFFSTSLALAWALHSAVGVSALVGHWIKVQRAVRIISSAPALPRAQRNVAIQAGGTVVATPPPETKVAYSDPAWTECFLKAGSDSEGSQRLEVWLFRTDTGIGFEKFLKHRHFGATGDSLECRSRQPDASIECLECVRVVYGGVYGSIGVVVPAYPLEKMATGCLSRNRIIEADFSDDDNYDGNPTRETALCNTHRAQLDGAMMMER